MATRNKKSSSKKSQTSSELAALKAWAATLKQSHHAGYCRSCLEPVAEYGDGYSPCCNKRIVDEEERDELRARR